MGIQKIGIRIPDDIFKHRPIAHMRAIMTENMSKNRRKAVSVLKIIFMYTRVCVFWGWEVPWNIYQGHQTSIQNGE